MNKKIKFPIRLQGTDGIRREIRHSKEIVPAVSPQEAFLEQGFLTEEFMELYAYAQVSLWLEKNNCAPGRGVVVGWDPRDPSQIFTRAVVQGIRRAGASACILGIVPTPLVPLYMVYAEAMGGLMVTASHNPPDQNGIKIFNAYRGLKPFPLNDEELSRRILELDYKIIRKLPLAGRKLDHRKSALELFRRFSLAPENSWIAPDSVQQNFFKNTLLVVDPANGSLSGLAAEIFRTAGFSNVYELNGGEGEVNSGGGVADLEGWKTISSQQAKRSGPFFSHKAVRKLFELGRKHKARLLKGTLRLWGAVFDADADRFYKLEYCADRDCLHVLGGDDTAFIQSRKLLAFKSHADTLPFFFNTVESDLNVSAAVEKRGLCPQMTAVGDKWIQHKFALSLIEKRILKLKQESKKIFSPTLDKEWKRLRSGKELPDVYRLQAFENRLDRLEQPGTQVCIPPSLALGSEETGHNITLGTLVKKNGTAVPVFFGNGLKSALNTFACEGEGIAPWKFRPGFKKTLYTYHIKKELFSQNSPLWRKVKAEVLQLAKTLGWDAKIKKFPEDTEMLYFEFSLGAHRRAALFVRNSGTENKIGVNLRCASSDAGPLQQCGERILRLLMENMKDSKSDWFALELSVLKQLFKEGPKNEQTLDMDSGKRGRMLSELLKQGLIDHSPKGLRITTRGKYLLTCKQS